MKFHYYYAIVDEIDSILIDEARTPLIISGPVPMSDNQYGELQPKVASLYSSQNLLCSRLAREAKAVLEDENASPEALDDAMIKLLQVKFGMPTHKQLLRILENGEIVRELEKVESKVRSDNNRGMLQEVQAELFFTIDEKTNEADLTARGREAISPGNPADFIMPDLLASFRAIKPSFSHSVIKISLYFCLYISAGALIGALPF